MLCAGVIARTPLAQSTDDEWETMLSVNVLGVVNPARKLFPLMCAQGFGKILAAGSIAAKNGGVASGPAYVASKAALDAWTRCASSEFADQGISFTTINMPLVRTPMIAPTGIYNNVPTLSPEQAADMVADACISKPVRIATRLGITGQVIYVDAGYEIMGM